MDRCVSNEVSSVVWMEWMLMRIVYGIAYGMERMHAAGSNFAMALDDQDITQLMPMRGDQYEQSVRSTSSLQIQVYN